MANGGGGREGGSFREAVRMLKVLGKECLEHGLSNSPSQRTSQGREPQSAGHITSMIKRRERQMHACLLVLGWPSVLYYPQIIPREWHGSIHINYHDQERQGLSLVSGDTHL